MRPASTGVAEFHRQIFHGPVCARRLQFVRRRTVLPDGVADGFSGVGLQRRLREQSGDESGQHIAAAALREMRIAGRIHKNFPVTAADERLMPLQNYPAVAKPPR